MQSRFEFGPISFVLLLLFSAGFVKSAAQPIPCAPTVWKEAPPKAVVDISLNKTKIHIGEWALVTFRITNCGSFPFYIPKTIQNVEWHGGFEDIVTGPPNGRVHHSGAAADYGPGYHPDVLKEVQESWILLMPGQFYGVTVPLKTAPMSRGTWKVIGRRSPPRVTDELRDKLRSALKFPVLFDPVDSTPIHFKAVK
ncbi:MAG TPA: hypothetical protein VKH18_11770 [Terriglobales bacterium]|nr:hypothetical protein [Terriglobales bacterium]